MDIITPEEYMGDVIGDINSRRGQVVELSERNGMKQVESNVPLANMFQVRTQELGIISFFSILRTVCT